MHNEPTIQQLFDSLRDYLMKEVMPLCKDNQSLSFRNLVAWNMLGVMSRELNVEDKSIKLASLYEQLLGAKAENLSQSRAEVAKAIREGNLKWDNPELIGAMLTDVEERLVVSNPRFTRDSFLEQRIQKD